MSYWKVEYDGDWTTDLPVLNSGQYYLKLTAYHTDGRNVLIETVPPKAQRTRSET